MRFFPEDSRKAQKNPLLYFKIRIQVKLDQKLLNLYHHAIQMLFVTAVEREDIIHHNIQSTRKVIYRCIIAFDVDKEVILLRVVLLIIIDSIVYSIVVVVLDPVI